MNQKKYLNIDVYNATQQRLKFIFDEFDVIYISISGGKDSGVLTNLVIDFIKQNNIKIKPGLVFIDLEAEYKKTIEFLERIFLSNLDVFENYWVCLPMLTTNSVSMYEPYWIFWDAEKKEKWVREMPSYNFVINESNNPLVFFKPKMTFEEFVVSFQNWFSETHQNKKVANLLGIRANESLNRFRAIVNQNKNTYKNCIYSTKIKDNLYNFYPIYDWKVEDIWIYNGKYNKDYNKTYDAFYKAGVSLTKMRICEPYGDQQKSGLWLFKILEPQTWNKIVDRVSGGNFGNIYCNSKILTSKNIELPKNHTWRSYCKFLLKTLPMETRNSYVSKFIKFINYWHKVGCGVIDEDLILLKTLQNDNIINTKQFSKRGKGDKFIVKFKTIPDVLPGLDNKTDFLSWKRLCMCIIKNDIICESLSFSLTKKQKEIQNKTIEKYKQI